MTLAIPQPVTAGNVTTCASCGCVWAEVEVGEPNLISDWCEHPCLCHSYEWVTVTYEGIGVHP